MKSVSITKIEHLPDITFGHSDATIRACYFILTRLALTKTGAIFAKWSKDDDFVAWKFSENTAFIFDIPDRAAEILRVPNPSVFRSMLARIGSASVGEVYLGAGIFDITFEDKTQLDNRFAIIFSNEKQTGYWIKLQVLTRIVPQRDREPKGDGWSLA